LGQFGMPVTFSSTGTGKVTIRDSGTVPAAGMLVYERGDFWKARWRMVDTVTAGGTVSLDLAEKPFTADWKKGIYADGIAMLTKAGLYRKEADAMLQTWWPSYFDREGLRVFWVVPRSFTDAVLPLSVNPAPKETVRVLVGRSEIM